MQTLDGLYGELWLHLSALELLPPLETEVKVPLNREGEYAAVDLVLLPDRVIVYLLRLLHQHKGAKARLDVL